LQEEDEANAVEDAMDKFGVHVRARTLKAVRIDLSMTIRINKILKNIN